MGKKPKEVTTTKFVFELEESDANLVHDALRYKVSNASWDLDEDWEELLALKTLQGALGKFLDGSSDVSEDEE